MILFFKELSSSRHPEFHGFLISHLIYSVKAQEVTLQVECEDVLTGLKIVY